MKGKFFALMAMLLTLMFSATALAAIPGINYNRYIKMYGLSSANDTPVYTSARLNQRGTASPFRAYDATIYANDEIWVFAMNDSIALISYPTNSGRRQGYVRTSALTSNNYSRGSQKCRNTLTNIYARPGVRYPNSSISNNDDVWTVARQGNYTQVVYPVGNVYKMAWISNSDYDNYISTQTPGPNVSYAYPAEGDYYIVPENSGAHAIDVPNNSHNEGTVLHIYSKNNSAAQTFTLKRVNNEWYKIIHKDSGYVINCYGGGYGNGNSLWLYHDDGTASCYWRFRDLGNDVYNIESQLPTNPYLEVQNGNPFNGAVLQLWQQHAFPAARWRLEKVTTTSASQSNSQISSGNYDSKVNAFKSDYKYQHNGNVGWDCGAYADEFAKIVFGKSSKTSGVQFNNPSEIKSGDIVHVNPRDGVFENPHWIVILYRNGSQLITMEGNWLKPKTNGLNGKSYGRTRYAEDKYTVENGQFCLNHSPFRKWDRGYHFQ